MSSYIKRILVDLIDINNDPLENIYIYYDESNIMEVYALILGNTETPYEGGYYYFKINFDETYPSKPPKCKFETINNKIRFYPNLYENGKICLSIFIVRPRVCFSTSCSHSDCTLETGLSLVRRVISGNSVKPNSSLANAK